MHTIKKTGSFIMRRWIIFVIILLVVAGVWWKMKSDQQKLASRPTYTVTRTTLKEILSFAGEIDAEEKATLQFQSSGRLAWVGVKEGEYVKKYQGIASLDQRELQKRLERYLNSFMTSRWSFDQVKDDNKEPGILGLTDDQRRKALRIGDKAQFDLNNAVIDVELQALAKEYAYLYTPIEGVVTQVDAPNAGVNINAATTKFVVINPKTLYFAATVDQTEVSKLQSLHSGDISFDAFPDRTVYGTIDSISFTPKEGENGTVYTMKVNFDNAANDQYRMGMTGDISFVTKEIQNVITVPTEALKVEGEKKYVEMKSEKGPKKVYVVTGDEIDGTTEVTHGLKEGDVIYSKL